MRNGHITDHSGEHSFKTCHQLNAGKAIVSDIKRTLQQLAFRQLTRNQGLNENGVENGSDIPGCL